MTCIVRFLQRLYEPVRWWYYDRPWRPLNRRDLRMTTTLPRTDYVQYMEWGKAQKSICS